MREAGAAEEAAASALLGVATAASASFFSMTH